jgi:hypothetical protein
MPIMYLNVNVKTGKGKHMGRARYYIYWWVGIISFMGCSLAIPYLGVTDDNFNFVKLISLIMGAVFGLFLLGYSEDWKSWKDAS